MNNPCVCGYDEYGGPIYSGTVKGKEFEVVRCVRCGLARTLPEPLNTDQILPYYQEQEDYNERISHLESWRKFSRKKLSLIKGLKSGGKFLDVGCNLGVLVEQAKAAGYDAVGVDLSQKAIEQGKKLLGLEGRLAVGGIESDFISGQRFDVIFYVHVFEHLPNPNIELQVIKRFLADDGILVIDIPGFDSLWQRVLGKKWYGYVPDQHYWQYGLRPVVAMLEKNGYAVRRAYSRYSIDHKVDFSVGGAVKALIYAVSWLTGTGDNLTVVASKK